MWPLHYFLLFFCQYKTRVFYSKNILTKILPFYLHCTPNLPRFADFENSKVFQKRTILVRSQEINGYLLSATKTFKVELVQLASIRYKK